MDDGDQVLDEGTVHPDPFAQFGEWYGVAADVMDQPEAMALATAGLDGRPSVRMVLLKGWGDDGFTFFTNYDSRKGHDLTVNPQAALLFHWHPLNRQVRIDGTVERIDSADSDTYFASRPFGSQVGAVASHQGRTIHDRAALDARAAEVAFEFDGRPVPRPVWWGGFRLRPTAFEFWQHGTDRLHDRIRYLRDGNDWVIDRLQP